MGYQRIVFEQAQRLAWPVDDAIIKVEHQECDALDVAKRAPVPFEDGTANSLTIFGVPALFFDKLSEFVDRALVPGAVD